MVQWQHDKVLVMEEVLSLLLSTIKISYGFWSSPIHFPHHFTPPYKILVGFPSLPNTEFLGCLDS